MASFQNSKFEIQKRRFKIQKVRTHTPTPTRTRPSTGNVIPQLHGWEATKPPPWCWCVGAWVCRHGRMGAWARAINRDWRGLQGGSEGETFLHFLLKWGRNCADNPIPYEIHSKNSSRLREHHGLHVNPPTQH